MSDLTVGQVLSMTDEELIRDLVESGEIPGCKVCGTPIQESVTGCRTIMDEEGVKAPRVNKLSIRLPFHSGISKVGHVQFEKLFTRRP